MNNTNKPGTNKAGRAPKGMPTDLNLYTLDTVFNGDSRYGSRVDFRDGEAGNTEASNRLSPTNVAGVKRCVKFGLVKVVGSTLVLTEMGISALCAYAFEHGQRLAAREAVRS